MLLLPFPSPYLSSAILEVWLENPLELRATLLQEHAWRKREGLIE